MSFEMLPLKEPLCICINLNQPNNEIFKKHFS